MPLLDSAARFHKKCPGFFRKNNRVSQRELQLDLGLIAPTELQIVHVEIRERGRAALWFIPIRGKLSRVINRRETGEATQPGVA
jgi:hypothetical protein